MADRQRKTSSKQATPTDSCLAAEEFWTGDNWTHLRLHWLHDDFRADVKAYLARFSPEGTCRFDGATPGPFFDFEVDQTTGKAGSTSAVWSEEFLRLWKRWPYLPFRFWWGISTTGKSYWTENPGVVVDPGLEALDECYADFDDEERQDLQEQLHEERGDLGKELFSQVPMVIPVYPWSTKRTLALAAAEALAFRDEVAGKSRHPRRRPPSLDRCLDVYEAHAQVGDWAETLFVLADKETDPEVSLAAAYKRRILELEGEDHNQEVIQILLCEEFDDEGLDAYEFIELTMARLRQQKTTVVRELARITPSPRFFLY